MSPHAVGYLLRKIGAIADSARNRAKETRLTGKHQHSIPILEAHFGHMRYIPKNQKQVPPGRP